MKKNIPDIRDYSQKPTSEWTVEDRIQSFEHAIHIVKKYTNQALLSTRGHGEALSLTMIKQSYMLLLQSGWSPEQIATFSVGVLDEFTGKVDETPPEPPSPSIIVEQ
jgi:hypothetical protein